MAVRMYLGPKREDGRHITGRGQKDEDGGEKDGRAEGGCGGAPRRSRQRAAREPSEQHVVHSATTNRLQRNPPLTVEHVVGVRAVHARRAHQPRQEVAEEEGGDVLVEEPHGPVSRLFRAEYE